MVCKNCNANNPEGTFFCSVCGTRIEPERPAAEAYPRAGEQAYVQQNMNQFAGQQSYQAAPPQPNVYNQPAVLPPVNTSPSTGKFFLWRFLCSLPIAGLIISIVFAASEDDVVRSRFCRGDLLFRVYMIVVNYILIPLIVFGVLIIIFGSFEDVFYNYDHIVEDIVDELMLISRL